MELSFFKSIILGIVQGLTEFLPISSTAHLILSSSFLKLELSDFLKSFIVIIQLGSILAVIILYWKKVFSNFSLYFKKVLSAFIPTAIIGLIFYQFVKDYLQESLEVISLALFLGGVLMMSFERNFKEKEQARKKEEEVLAKAGETLPIEKKEGIESISYKQAVIIGVFQALAIVPGVSRSAATILGGLALGISRVVIVEFSFLLAVPTILAASSLDLYKSALSFSGREIALLSVGFIVSFIIAWLSIKFLLSYIKKNSFSVFAWYRVILAFILFLWLYA